MMSTRIVILKKMALFMQHDMTATANWEFCSLFLEIYSNKEK